MSLGQKGFLILLLKTGPDFSQWPKLAGAFVHSTKSLQSMMSLDIGNETVSTKSDVFLAYKSQNSFPSGKNLSL